MPASFMVIRFLRFCLEGRLPSYLHVSQIGVIASNPTRLVNASFGGVTPHPTPPSPVFLIKKIIFGSFFLGKNTFYPLIDLHFCLQSLKCDTSPPKTFKLWQFNPFDLFIPKMPSS